MTADSRAPAAPSAPTARLRRATARVVGDRDPGLLLTVAAAVLLGLAYAVWATQRQRWYLTDGYDLGIFDQAARHLAHLQWPASSIREVDNLWGDHFHPIIVVWGLARAIWPSPNALLVTQAAVVAAAMVPLYLFARERAGRWPALLIALAYGSSWGVQRAIDFDVHELAFGPLFLACAVLFADRRRWGWYWLSALLLLTVKEDVSLLVVAVGLWLALAGERRHGLATMALGAAWYLAATRWWIPHFADGQPFSYWSYHQFGDDLPSALGHLITHPWKLVTVAVSPAPKAETLLFLFAPFLLVTPWLTRLAVIPLPLLAERFLSDQPVYWGNAFHYSLLPMAALAIASAGGVGTIRGWIAARPAWADRRALRALPVALAAAGLVVGTGAWFKVYGSHGTFGESPLASMARLQPPARVVDRELLDRVVAAVPRSGAIAAPQMLQPHLTGRDQDVFLLESRNPDEPVHAASADNVVLDLPGSDIVNLDPGEMARVMDAVEQRLVRGDLVPVRAFGEGWIILRSPRAPGGARRPADLAPLSGRGADDARRALRRWSAETGRWLAACTPAIGCTAPALAELRRAARQQTAALRAAAAAAEGGCRGVLDEAAKTPDLVVARLADRSANPQDVSAATWLRRTLEARYLGAPRRALLVCTRSAVATPAPPDASAAMPR
ncbi:DUF2079 domain-containing protein [Patulibacter defluvii]|uniref:DUF2079 domain-containing protein n=1 Tax=Patulibacter defluvii TaxID=3095358 RepID=UPI002A74B53C|nr:DUF2079 domain-containing protein [Patulibacter sp. DM4]